MASPTSSSTAKKSGLIEKMSALRAAFESFHARVEDLPSDPIHGLDCGPPGLKEKAGFP